MNAYDFTKGHTSFVLPFPVELRPLLHHCIAGHTTNDILNHYVGIDPDGAMRTYFASIRPLLDAIAEKAQQLGLCPSPS